MLDTRPSQPSKPPTAWVYLSASFLLIYGTLLYFFLTRVWPLAGFGAGVGTHLGYYVEGFRSLVAPDREAALKWNFYVNFMNERDLWIPFGLRALGAFVLLPGVVAGLLARFSFTYQNEVHVRGLRYEPALDKAVGLALRHLDSLKRTGRERRDWFKIHPQIAIPPALTNTGVLCIGAIGAGKTNFLLPILQQLVASPHRSLILDVKGDFTEKLRYPNDAFIFIAPWDGRGWRWDIANDVTSLSQARLFAESCIPPSDEPLWSTGARQIFAGLMNYLCLTRPGRWDLMDFIDLTRLPDEDLIGIVREGNPDAERVIANLQKENRTGQSILINLTAFIGPLADLAWAWRQHPAAPAFAVNEWLADDTTLPKGILLQSRRRFGEISEALTNALVTLLTDRIVDTAFPEADARNTDWRLYVVLDEIAQSRKIEALQSFSSAGRSKGVHLFVGIQSITQLRKIYGPEFADLLYTNLLCRYIGRTPDGDSAEWLARKLGVEEVERLSNGISLTHSENGRSEQVNQTWVREQKKVLLASQLAAELGPDFPRNQIRGLLSVSGWSHVLRLAWPKVTYETVRPALEPAAWAGSKAWNPQACAAERRERAGVEEPAQDTPCCR